MQEVHGKVPEHLICAVIVTRDRAELLERLLARIAVQSLPPHRIIVVDNSRFADISDLVTPYPNVVHLKSQINLGGAGGFVYGIMHAIALGSSSIWIMDDDGHPETDECLADLTTAMKRGRYDMVSPLILDICEPSRLAFFYYKNGRPLKTRSEIRHGEIIPQFAHLFNGALIATDVFARFGLPRYELFFRGDEVDFMFRLRRGGASFATIADVAFLHPSGERDAAPILGGRYHAIVPSSAIARYYYHRNRGNLFREFGLYHLLAYDVMRYAWFYIITQSADVDGLMNWFRATWGGWSQRFVPYDASEPAKRESDARHVDRSEAQPGSDSSLKS